MALTKLSSFILANTGVTSGTYGNANTIHAITINSEGQVTSAANVVYTPSYLAVSGTQSSNITVLATTVASDIVNTYAHLYTTGMFVANTDQSIQLGVQNFANTGNSSSDIALYNNIGTDTSNYVDLGIISQNYNTTLNSFTAANPGDAYLYSNGSNLLIGAYTAGKAIKFFVNGYNAANVGVVINAPNTISTSTSTGTLTVVGDTGISGNVNIGGTLNVTGNITFSNTTINNVTLNTTDQVIVTNTTPSTSNSTGALIISGGIGVKGNVYSTGTITGTLASTGVTTGTYGGSSAIPVITINAGGQITYAGNASITIPPSTAIFANSGQLTANASTGNVLIGLATSGVTAGVYGNSSSITSITVDAYGRITAVANNAVTGGIANNSVAQLASLGVGTSASGTTGEIRATNNITAYYSDDRLKTKLGAIVDALDKVKSLNGFYYEANETAQALGYEPIREVGVSAQEVQAILPEIVVPAPIDDKYLTVRYEKLIPLLVEAIKELSEEVNRLKDNK